MDKNKVDKYKSMLLKEREDIKQTIKGIKDNFDGSITNASGEISAYDNHPADIGTELFMQEHNIKLSDNQKNIMTKINIALKNINEGNFGNCIVCGKEIEEERLDIIPYTVTCKNHREKIDEVIGMTDTKEQEYLSNILRRMNKDDKDYVGTDGEDIIQKVEQFNRIENDPSNSTGDYNGVFDDNDKGSVEDIESISEEFYEGQMPGEHREDIPDDQKE
ncbi:TraR/DksA C4-type zinc finger protein [Senegalia massiliensis]|uniref:TraR/DksA C4-type zinc finger protein n=1 Tax=Senegalia massiliensis TaxID=1720316 RepID=UPI00102F867C|nr:TraR/DksA C4-type zinc finger protein [Senegalia massiliensis]